MSRKNDRLFHGNEAISKRFQSKKEATMKLETRVKRKTYIGKPVKIKGIFD